MAPVTIKTNALGWREVSTTVFWSARVLWDTGTALYAVVQDTGASPRIRVFKADSRTAPTAWAEQDAANNKAGFQDAPFDSWLKGTTIHIGYQTATANGAYIQFDTATDTFSASPPGRTMGSTLVAKRSLRIAAHSNNTRVVAAMINSGDDADLTYYSTTDPATTGFGFSGTPWMAANTTEALTPVELVADSVGIVYAFAYDAAGDDFSYVSATNAGVLGTLTDIETAAASAETAHGAGARFNVYDDAGTDKVIAAFITAGGTIEESVVTLESASAGGNVAANVVVEATAANVGTRTPISTAVVSGVPYCAWWDDASSGTIYYATKSGGAWTRSTFATGITRLIEVVPVGIGLAVVYQSGSDVVMDFIVSAVANITISGVLATGTAAQSIPTIRGIPQIPVQAASSLQNVPTPILRIADTLATVAGAGSAPLLLENISIPLATALAAFLAPTIPGMIEYQEFFFRRGKVWPYIRGTVSTKELSLGPFPAILESVLPDDLIIEGVLTSASALMSNPSMLLRVLNTLAIASGEMASPTLIAKVLDTLATASGTQLNPTPKITIADTLAALSGATFDPAFLIGPNTFVVPLMTVSGLTLSPSLRAIVQSSLATVSGSSVAPNVRILAAIPAQTASALFHIPNFLIGPNVFIVPLMDASGITHIPSLRLTANIPLGAIGGTTQNPALISRVLDTLATASAQTHSPTLVSTVIDTLATASAISHTPSLLLRVVDTLATASGQTYDPAFLIGPNTIVIPLMAVSGVGQTPTLRAVVQVPLSAASAATFNPTIALRILDTLAAVGAASFDPIVAVEDAPIVVDIDLAPISGVGLVPVVRIYVLDTLALSTVATANSSVRLTVPAPSAPVNATSFDPVFLIGPNIFVVPIMTTSSQPSTPTVRATVQTSRPDIGVNSIDPSARLTVVEPTAAGSGIFLTPITQEGATVVTVPVNESGAVSYPPLVRSVIQATLSTATSTATSPTIRLTIPAPLMAAVGFFPEPYVDVVIDLPVTIDVPVSEATANFLTPGLKTNVVATLSHASIDGGTPRPVIEILSPEAEIDAESGAPVLRSIVLIPQKIGSATGINPSTVSLIPTSTMDALVSFLDPRLETRVLVDRMSAIGTFLEPYLSAELPWAMQFVALARTLIVETRDRATEADASDRTLYVSTREQEGE